MMTLEEAEKILKDKNDYETPCVALSIIIAHERRCMEGYQAREASLKDAIIIEKGVEIDIVANTNGEVELDLYYNDKVSNKTAYTFDLSDIQDGLKEIH